jgi:hypothetical protein
MSTPEQMTATEATNPTWFRELADANATLPTWLLLVVLFAGLIGFATGLATLLTG